MDQIEETKLSAPTPAANRPGQRAISYRAGVHGTFLRRMLARLQDAPSLAALTTRDRDDPTVAMLDAWATAADVITFYQERIANEGYLRTASERRSALELARFVGHELSPGLAASAFLAFTVEDAPGAPAAVAVPQGTRVQSVPRPGRLPQTFETSAPLIARAAANALSLRLREPQTVGRSSALIRGLGAAIRPDDRLLLVGKEATARHLVTVVAVTPDALLGHTLIAWSPELTEEQHRALGKEVRLFVFRQRANLFGHNAPDLRLLADSALAQYFDNILITEVGARRTAESSNWPAPVAAGAAIVKLDGIYRQVQPASWVAFITGTETSIATVKEVAETTENQYFLSAQVTQLTLTNGFAQDLPTRLTTVLIQSEELALAEQPVDPRLAAPAAELHLTGLAEWLAAGQLLAVSGELWGESGATGAEVVVLERVEPRDGGAVLHLARGGLTKSYVRATVTINTNVVLATHGETVAGEVLGSGDGGQANQRFKLRRAPLTHLPAPTAAGAASTLTVRVDGVHWREVPALNNLAPDDRVYTLRRDDAGDTYVIFGDGVNGARLPSGQENVVATYRAGLGLAGKVDAGSLTLLQTRPMGIRSVVNPLPSSGAAPPEGLEVARERVPRGVLTLGRIVSARDYEDFARGFAGVGQAQAAMIWTGQTRLIHITIADALGGAVPPNSELPLALEQAIKALGNPLQRFQIDTFEERPFGIEASIWPDPRYAPGAVLEAVAAALAEAFAGSRRSFGQGVTGSEVIVAIQRVPGVLAVDLDGLTAAQTNGKPVGALEASRARWDSKSQTLLRAERLGINKDAIKLEVAR